MWDFFVKTATPRPGAMLMEVRPLKGYGSFDKIIRQGHKVFHRGIVAFVRLIPEDERKDMPDGRILKLGVTCKKRTRPAVMRNRIKRLMRESMRNLCRSPHLGPQFWSDWPVQELVLVWTAIPSHPRLLRQDEVERTIEAALRKAAGNYRLAMRRRNAEPQHRHTPPVQAADGPTEAGRDDGGNASD